MRSKINNTLVRYMCAVFLTLWFRSCFDIIVIMKWIWKVTTISYMISQILLIMQAMHKYIWWKNIIVVNITWYIMWAVSSLHICKICEINCWQSSIHIYCITHSKIMLIKSMKSYWNTIRYIWKQKLVQIHINCFLNHLIKILMNKCTVHLLIFRTKICLRKNSLQFFYNENQ